jgi:hypothetical protein
MCANTVQLLTAKVVSASSESFSLLKNVIANAIYNAHAQPKPCTIYM